VNLLEKRIYFMRKNWRRNKNK